MANTREIQSRMKSIQDTMKITNAMYMISSTKLRKAKKNLEETEPSSILCRRWSAELSVIYRRSIINISMNGRTNRLGRRLRD